MHSHSVPKLWCLYWNIINWANPGDATTRAVTPSIPGCLPALHCSFQNKTFPRGNTPTWQVLFQLLFIELLENAASRKRKSSSSFFPQLSLLSLLTAVWPVHEQAAGLGHSFSPLTPLSLIDSSRSMIRWIQTFFVLLFCYWHCQPPLPYLSTGGSSPGVTLLQATEQQERVWSCYSFTAVGGKKKEKHFIKRKLQSNSTRQLCLDPLSKTGFMMMLKCTLSIQQTSLNPTLDMSYSYFDIFLKCVDIHSIISFHTTYIDFFSVILRWNLSPHLKTWISASFLKTATICANSVILN